MVQLVHKIVSILITILILCLLTGCDMESADSSMQEDEIDCSYSYAYSCGYDIFSGSTKCGYGYYYNCR